MLALLAAVALAPADTVALAYTARYYSTDGKTKTHSQVYLSGIDGKGRKAFTKGTLECSAVRWVSKNALVWIQGTDEVSDLWYGTVDGKNRKKIGKVDYVVPSVSGNAREGGPVYALGQDYFQVTDGKLRKVEPVDNGWKGDKKWSSAGASLTVTVRQWPFDWSYVLTSSGASKGEDFSDQNFSLEQVREDKATRRAWVVAFTGNSTNGGSYTVQEVDWRGARLVTRCTGQDVDYGWTRDLWATISTRELTPLGKGEVWITTASVGNQRTGKTWNLPGKLVSFTSISLRPQ